jgi:multiple sugar transport system permease protein
MQHKLFGRYALGESASALLLGGPAFLLLSIFLALPFVRAIQLSFTNQFLVQPRNQPAQNVGFDNYDRLLSFSLIQLDPQLDPETGDWQRDRRGDVVFRWRPRTPPAGYENLVGFNILYTFKAPDLPLVPESVAGRYHALMAKDPLFWRALFNNFYFALFVVPIQSAFALGLALLVDQKLRGMTLYRTIYFSPVVTAMAVISVLWIFLYNPDRGLINRLLETLSFGGLGPFRWINDPHEAMPAIMLMSIWQGAGFQMVIFLAGLQNIPEDLYEASGIDGAGTLAKFRFITLPMLRNSIVFVAITTTILAFRLFTQVEVMTGGGPENATMTVIWYAIEQGWRTGQGNVGYASAISVIFVSIVLIISILQRGIIRSYNVLER